MYTFLLNVLIIVGVGIALRAIAVRIRDISYSALLVAAGLVVTALQYDFAIDLSYDLIIHIILPPILFAGSCRLDVRHFRSSLPLVLLLLIVALPVCVLLMGAAWHFAFGFSWLAALLLGAMLYPLDPASIISVFKEVDPPARLLAMIEGEPLFDDGLAVVIYTTLISIMRTTQSDQISAEQLFNFSVLQDLVLVSTGGLLLGAILALIVFVFGSRLVNDRSADLLMSLFVVYGSVFIAEHYLHVSGIMAVVGAGVTARIAQERRTLTAETGEFVRSIWEMAEFLVSTFIFLLVGALLDLNAMVENWHLILFGVGIFLIVRAAMVYALIPVGNYFMKDPVPMKYGLILVWGALHTVVPVAMALGLPAETPSRALLQTIVFGGAIVSILMQGLTISAVLRRSGLSAAEEHAPPGAERTPGVRGEHQD